MRKIAFLLLVLLFTGCSVEYNVNLNDKISEQTMISNIDLDSYNLFENKPILVYYSDQKK